jgi:hypothetical protein
MLAVDKERKESMKLIRTVGIAVLVFLLAVPSVFAQGAGTAWDILNKEAMELYRTGNYERTVVVAKKALEVAEKNFSPDHPSVATSLDNLATL